MLSSFINFRSRLIILFLSFATALQAQKSNSFKADFNPPESIAGYDLVWHDEFNKNGKPDTANWRYENGFVRNEELQWYQPANAACKNGVLLIEGRKQKVKNPDYIANSPDWRLSREYAEYTSASLQTKGHQQWKYGRFEIRARIDTSQGAWPAIWTLGTTGSWPSNGEVDIMEFYRIDAIPVILANTAWGTGQPLIAKWHTERRPLSIFTLKDAEWVKKFHLWRMDWNRDSISLFLDDMLMNTTLLHQTRNADSTNPFHQPHFLLLNLALGGHGGDPSKAKSPIKYEIDYVRVYQKNNP